jgi:hypothetical protein
MGHLQYRADETKMSTEDMVSRHESRSRKRFVRAAQRSASAAAEWKALTTGKALTPCQRAKSPRFSGRLHAVLGRADVQTGNMGNKTDREHG